MAQYGNNIYGASYYGINGVFAGQFVSDKTALPSPLIDSPPDIGESMIYNAQIKHTFMEYSPLYDTEPFIFTGVWSNVPGAKITSDMDMNLQITITGADFTLFFNRRDMDGAVVDISVTEYKETPEGLNELGPQTYTINTKESDYFDIPETHFGNYKIEITMNSSTTHGSVFEFVSIKARTTDVKLELRFTYGNDNWTDWYEPEFETIFEPSTNIEDITWNSGDVTGIVGYQFKIMMASSDNTTSPEVIRLWVHSGNTGEYVSNGYWKMLIDLGSDWNPATDSIDRITYTAYTPDKTNAEIRSRVTEDSAVIDPWGEEFATWEYWTIPYSHSPRRIVLDIKSDPGDISNTEGYIITPLINPENLTHWVSFIPKLFVSSVDPTGTVTNNLTSIVIDILKEDLSIATVDGSKQSFEYKATTNLPQSMNGINHKIRLKATIKRNINQSTPGIDGIFLKAAADYTEIREFGTGEGQYKAYGSAVFGDNTGVDAVFTNGLARTQLASISKLAFNFPTAQRPGGPIVINDPSYTITNTNIPDGVTVFWSSQRDMEDRTNSIYLSESLSDDYVMVEVKADGNKIKKHRQYGSGITIKVSDPYNENYDSCVISNVFTPALEPNKKYVYHLANGFPNGEPNPNVDIRWNTENALLPREPDTDHLELNYRRNVVYEPGQQINASITHVTTGMMAPWKSQERIFEGVVNIGSPSTPRITRIHLDSTHDLPEIPGDVVIEENPYKVEIVDGSVVSEGEIRENDRITISIDNSFNTYTIASEEKAPVIKLETAIDYLPKHRTIKVNGIYTSLNQYAPLYIEGVDFFIREDRCTIDWTPALVAEKPIPEPGSVMYISYTYEKLAGIDVEASCDYNKNEYDMLNIYRTKPIYINGRCSVGVDYVSEKYDINELWPDIPPTVDKQSMVLKATVTDNDLISIKVMDNKVIASLGDNDPRENWHPHIKDGFYYIGKNQYYLSTSPYQETLDDSHIPKHQNIIYTDGAVLIQEQTENLISNSRFDILDEADNIFIDRFER